MVGRRRRVTRPGGLGRDRRGRGIGFCAGHWKWRHRDRRGCAAPPSRVGGGGHHDRARAMTNPWIFSEIKEAFAGETLAAPTLEDRWALDRGSLRAGDRVAQVRAAGHEVHAGASHGVYARDARWGSSARVAFHVESLDGIRQISEQHLAKSAELLAAGIAEVQVGG